MKRLLSFFLLLILLPGLLGCGSRTEQPEAPVRFYYPRSAPTYGSADSVISHEAREAAGHTEDCEYLLALYFQGPQSETLTNIFPQGTHLVSLSIGKSSVFLILSEEFAALNGMDLTLACASLTLTLYHMTGLETTRIMAENGELDGKELITMNVEDLLLLDHSGEDATQD